MDNTTGVPSRQIAEAATKDDVRSMLIRFARWLILIGLCSTAAGVFSFFQQERHSFVSTQDFEFFVLERMGFPVLMVGLLTTIIGSVLWAWRAAIHDVALYGLRIMVFVVPASLIPLNPDGWTAVFAFVELAGMLIGVLFFIFAVVRTFNERRAKS